MSQNTSMETILNVNLKISISNISSVCGYQNVTLLQYTTQTCKKCLKQRYTKMYILHEIITDVVRRLLKNSCIYPLPLDI